jgi:hypothetical protein
MGAGIVVLCANAGFPVLFLDMPAAEGARNGVAATALEGMQGPRQPMPKDTGALARITVGNFEDDLAKIAGHDWVVEALIEDLAVEQDFFTRVEALRSEGSIVTSNTSSIMLRAITGRPGPRHCDYPFLQLGPGYEAGGTDPRRVNRRQGDGHPGRFSGRRPWQGRGFRQGYGELYRQSDWLLLAAQRPEPGLDSV